MKAFIHMFSDCCLGAQERNTGENQQTPHGKAPDQLGNQNRNYLGVWQQHQPLHTRAAHENTTFSILKTSEYGQDQ